MPDAGDAAEDVDMHQQQSEEGAQEGVLELREQRLRGSRQQRGAANRQAGLQVCCACCAPAAGGSPA